MELRKCQTVLKDGPRAGEVCGASCHVDSIPHDATGEIYYFVDCSNTDCGWAPAHDPKFKTPGEAATAWNAEQDRLEALER